MKKQNMAPESPINDDLEAENRRIAALDPAALEAEFADPYNIPPDFWAEGEVDLGPNKVEIHIRLDSDAVDWFKQRGRGYQSRINSVLRQYVQAQKLAEAKEQGRQAAQAEKVGS